MTKMFCDNEIYKVSCVIRKNSESVFKLSQSLTCSSDKHDKLFAV